MPLTDYQRNWLIQQQGLDPDKYTLDGNEENIIPKPTKDQPSLNSTPYEAKLSPNPGFTSQNSGNQNSALETFAKAAATSAFPSLTAGAGAGGALALGAALAPETMGASMLLPIGVGIAGALTGGYVGRGIQNKILPQSIQENVAQAEQEHPNAAILGSLATMPLGGLNPSPANVGSAARAIPKLFMGMAPKAEELGNLLNVGIGAGVGAAQPIAQYALSPEGTPFPTNEVVGSALGGAVFNKPNAIGKRLGFHSPDIQDEFTREMLAKQSRIPSPAKEPIIRIPEQPEPELQTFGFPKLSDEQMQAFAELKARRDEKLAKLKSQPFGQYPTEAPKSDYISKVEATQPTDEDLFEAGKKPVYSEESNLHEETPPISHKEYADVYDKWEDHAAFIGQALFPDKTPDEQIRIGKNAIEAIQKRDPVGRRVMDILVSRNKLDINKSQEFEDIVRGLANTLRESNFGKGQRYSEPSSIKTPQEVETREALEKEGLSGNLTRRWLDFAQKLGILRNIKVVEDGTIKNIDTDEPVAGQTAARQGLKEVIAKVNPALAGADTPVHEEFHSFVNDMRNSPRGRDNAIVEKYDKLVADNPDYQAWAAKRKAAGLESNVEEFQATNAGQEAVNRAISNDTKWQQWWKDMSAYAKTRFGEHGTIEDFQRIMHYKLLHDPAFSKVFGEGTGAIVAPRVVNAEQSNLKEPSDYDKYQAAQAEMRRAFHAGDNDALAKAFAENEEIKNRHGGLPPVKNAEKSNLVNPRDDSVVTLIHTAVTKSDVGELSPEELQEARDTLINQVKWDKNSRVLAGLKNKDFDPEDVEHWKAIQNFYNEEQFKYESPEEEAKARRREKLKEEAKQVPTERPLPLPKKEKVTPQVKEEVPPSPKPTKALPITDLNAEHEAVQAEMAAHREKGTKYTPELVERFKNVRRQMKAEEEANAPSVAEQLKKSIEARQVHAEEESPSEPIEAKVSKPEKSKTPYIKQEFEPGKEYNFERDRKELSTSKEAKAKAKAAKTSWETVDRVTNPKDAEKLAENLRTKYIDLQFQFEHNPNKTEGDYLRAQQIRIRAQLDTLQRQHGIDAKVEELPKYAISSNLASNPSDMNLRVDELRESHTANRLPYATIGLTRTLLDDIRSNHGSIGDLFSDAYIKYAQDKDAVYGEGMKGILDAAKGLSKGDLNKVENVRIQEYRDNRSIAPNLLNAKQMDLYNAITDALRPFNQGNEFYHPNKINPDAIETLTERPNSTAVQNLKQDFLDFQTQQQGKSLADAQATLKSIIDAYDSNRPNLSRFREIRTLDRTQLPNSWMRNGLLKGMSGFFNRAAADLAFESNFTQNAPVKAAIEKGGSLSGAEDVEHALSKIYGEPFNKDESWLKTLNRVATSLFLGPLTNMHIAASSIANSLQYLHPGEVVPAYTKALSNLTSGYEKALQQGYERKNLSTFSDILDKNATLLEKVQSAASLISRINGRDATNAFTKGFLQNIGEFVINAKQAAANAGNADAIRIMKQVDPDWTTSKTYSADELQKMASGFAGMIHGTHDARTLPAWMLRDTAVQPFFQLASWNIAQTNAWMKHVWTPLQKGNAVPFLMSTLGALGGGYVINKLRETIGDKKSPIPSFVEMANSDKGIEGNIPLAAYKAMALSSYVGFAGILSQAGKIVGDVAFKNIPQSATFPLDEVISGVVHRPLQAISAMINDPNVHSMDDYVNIVTKLATDITKENIQFGRIAVSWLARNPDLMPTENYYKMLNQKTSQLRRYKMVEGKPYEAQTASTGNPYMDLQLKKFKHTQDIGEAAQEVPELIENAIERAQGNPDTIRALLHKIKANVYETMPDPESNPYTFGKYYNFISKELGPKEASDLMVDYFTKKAINHAKSGMIPSL